MTPGVTHSGRGKNQKFINNRARDKKHYPRREKTFEELSRSLRQSLEGRGNLEVHLLYFVILNTDYLYKIQYQCILGLEGGPGGHRNFYLPFHKRIKQCTTVNPVNTTLTFPSTKMQSLKS